MHPRWNLIGILAHPATRGLDYYCRLDTHSNILSNVSDDMFGHMAAHGLHYGFVARCRRARPGTVVAQPIRLRMRS